MQSIPQVVPRHGGCGQDLRGLHVLGIRSLVCRVILPVVLYVCVKVGPVHSGERHRLRVSENRVLRVMFEP